VSGARTKSKKKPAKNMRLQKNIVAHLVANPLIFVAV